MAGALLHVDEHLPDCPFTLHAANDETKGLRVFLHFCVDRVVNVDEISRTRRTHFTLVQGESAQPINTGKSREMGSEPGIRTCWISPRRIRKPWVSTSTNAEKSVNAPSAVRLALGK